LRSNAHRARKRTAQEGRHKVRGVQLIPKGHGRAQRVVKGAADTHQVSHRRPRCGVLREKEHAVKLRVGARHVTEQSGADRPRPERQETEACVPRRRSGRAQRGENADCVRQPGSVRVVKHSGALAGKVNHPRAVVGEVDFESATIRAEKVIVFVQRAIKLMKHAERSVVQQLRVELRRRAGAERVQTTWKT